MISIYTLRKAMTRFNKTTIQVAEESGVSKSTLFRFLKGRPLKDKTNKLLEEWIDSQEASNASKMLQNRSELIIRSFVP